MKHPVTQQGLWKRLHPSLSIATKGIATVFACFTVLNVDLVSAQTGEDPCAVYRIRYESSHPSNVDPDDIANYKAGYGECLLIQGKRSEGLSLLQELREQSNHVAATYIIAQEHSGLHSKNNPAKSLINGHDHHLTTATIEAFTDTIFFISIDSGYPAKYDSYWKAKWVRNLKLLAHYQALHHMFHKYECGSIGQHHQALLSSPSYTGDQNLDTCHKYSPYVIDSLNVTIEFAQTCLALPKENYYDAGAFTSVKEYCGDMKKFAKKILSLELEKKKILIQEYCKDPLQCPEYESIHAELKNILETWRDNSWRNL